MNLAPQGNRTKPISGDALFRNSILSGSIKKRADARELPKRGPRKNGLKMVAIGLGAAAIGFLIGRLFHTTGARRG